MYNLQKAQHSRTITHISQPSMWTHKDVYKVNEWIKADPDITTKELAQKFNKNGTIVFS